MPSAAHLIRRARGALHWGIVHRDEQRPWGLWLSRGVDLGRIGIDRPRRFVNVTLFGRFYGRIYARRA